MVTIVDSTEPMDVENIKTEVDSAESAEDVPVEPAQVSTIDHIP